MPAGTRTNAENTTNIVARAMAHSESTKFTGDEVIAETEVELVNKVSKRESETAQGRKKQRWRRWPHWQQRRRRQRQ